MPHISLPHNFDSPTPGVFVTHKPLALYVCIFCFIDVMIVFVVLSGTNSAVPKFMFLYAVI